MRGSIVKRGRKYSFVIFLGTDENGKKKQKWISGFNTKREAEKGLNRTLYEIDNNTFVNADKILLRDYMNDWFENHVVNNLKKTTSDGYRNIIDKRINVHLGHIPISKIKPIQIQNFYDNQLRDGRADGKGGLSATTVIQTHRVLRKALNRAEKLQVIGRNPADFVELPKKKKYYAEILYEEDIPEFLDAFRDTDIFVSVMLALTLGLRRGEVLGLRWEDVDYRNKTISINQTITHGSHGLTFTTPKTESSRRTILVSEKLIELLKEHMKEQDKMREFFGRGYMENNLVNCREDGSPITPSALSHRFTTRLKSKGLKHIRFHDLRHTNATLMLKHNIPAKVASSRLGHSTIGITMDLYSHVLNEMQTKVVSVIDNIMK